MVAGNGDRHDIRPTGLLTRRSYPSAGRTVEAGCGTRIWGQTRCPIYRSGTFNVKRSTLNFQRGYRNGAWWTGYGDRHDIWAPEFLAGRTCPSAARAVEATGARRYGDRHDVLPAGPAQEPAGVAQTWGQTRSLGDRASDTPNLTKRRSDGRGWLRHPDMGKGTMSYRLDLPRRLRGSPRHGDRHGVWATGLLSCRT